MLNDLQLMITEVQNHYVIFTVNLLVLLLFAIGLVKVSKSQLIV